MATSADKKRWDKLHADYAKAREEFGAYEMELGRQYNYERGWQTWLNKGQRNKLERLRARADKIGDKIVDFLVRISPRGEAWLTGVPAQWIREELTWEDAIRPAAEPLSVVVPGAYGYPDGYVREQGSTSMEITIPKMPMWEQIGGDMDPGAHGGILARSDGDALEMLEIQPVRAHVGDSEAAEVGFPFWTREAYYDLADLDPNKKDVQHALQFIGMELGTLEADYTPTQRALVIAEALLGYGHGVDEGPAGWSDDIYADDEVKWWSGGVQTIGDALADEDEEFRNDVLGHGEIKEKLEEAVQQMVDESAAQGWSQVDDQTMIDLDGQGYKGQSAFAIADFGDTIAVNTELTLAPSWAKELGIKTDANVLIWSEIGTRELESWLEKNGYEVTDRGGDVPTTEGYAYAEHVVQRVAREMKLPQETIEEAAKALDWWQEEIPGSTDGYVTIWAQQTAEGEE